MVEEYKVAKIVLKENNVEIKKGNYVNINLGENNFIRGKIKAIYKDDVRIVDE